MIAFLGRKLKGSREEKERLSKTPEPPQGAFGPHSRTNSMNSVQDHSAPVTAMQTPYLNASSSHQIPSTLTTDQLIFQDSLSVKDTKELLQQLDQAQLQLQEFLSEESTGFQLPTPRQSHDFSNNQENFWDLSMMNDLDPSNALPHINAPNNDYFDALPKGEDISIVRSRSNSAVLPAKSDMFLTPSRACKFIFASILCIMTNSYFQHPSTLFLTPDLIHSTHQRKISISPPRLSPAATPLMTWKTPTAILRFT